MSRGTRPWLRVWTDPLNHSGWVKGWGARELIIQHGGKPIWSRRRRAWSTSEGTALDVLAAAEHEGYAIQYEQIKREAAS